MIWPQNSPLIVLLSGIAFFLFGMTLASTAVEKLFANQISRFLDRLSGNSFYSIVLGISITTILQSSGSVTSMLVGMGSTRMISLRHLMGVIIGAAIGSTITVQIISLPLAKYALPVFSVGFAIFFLAKKTGLKHFASILMGFALLFFGMSMMGDGTQHLLEIPFYQDILSNLKTHPYVTLFVALLVCAILHSSAVTIALAMILAGQNVINLHEAIFWVLGANIGTTSTALIAAIGTNYVGKQVAWAHFFYKATTVALFTVTPLHRYLVDFLNNFETFTERSVANAHLIFNLVAGLIFFPFIKPGSKLIERAFPKTNKEDFKPEYLNLNNYQSSALAIAYAQREILRCADIVLSMIQDSLKILENPDPALIESIKDRDNKVDLLYRETKMFLIDHANKSQTVVHQNIMGMIMFISDIERAADAIDINMITLAIKKGALKLEFSHEGWEEIKSLHNEVIKLASHSIQSYIQRDLCENVIGMKRELAKLEIQLRENHIGRLNRGLRESITSSSIHLDILSEYKRIAGLVSNHAYNRNMEET